MKSNYDRFLGGDSPDEINETSLGEGSLVPHLTLPRIVLTKTQKRVFGNLPFGTSNKLLCQNKKSEACKDYILNQFLIASNGGINPAEINQKKLREQKKPKFARQMITDVLKFLLHHEILVKHMQHARGKNSIFYVAGPLLKELLEPEEIKKDIKKKFVADSAATMQKYRNAGYNPEHSKKCLCCHRDLKLTKFAIWNEGDLSPVCGGCHGTNKPAANQALRLYFSIRDKGLSDEIERDESGCDVTDEEIEELLAC